MILAIYVISVIISLSAFGFWADGGDQNLPTFIFALIISAIPIVNTIIALVFIFQMITN